MIDFSIPLSGMNQAEAKLNQTASRIASIGGTPGGDSVDLSAEMIAMMQAKNSFAVNTKVAQTEDQVTRSLLNLLG
jgi:flagellar hook protein FlgE